MKMSGLAKITCVALYLITPIAVFGQQIEVLPSGATVVQNEYVITLNQASALRSKDKRTISQANREARIAGESRHFALVKGAPGQDLCGDIRKTERQERIAQSHAGKAILVRRITCEPNGLMTISESQPGSVIPNDPQFYSQWGFSQSNNVHMHMPQAWASYTGSKGVVVAVIDTGIDYNHEDLSDNIWTNEAEIAGNGIDDDANGYIDDVHGYNFVSNTGNPMDDHGHGTHVAGTIGALGNNGKGVTGVNWKVQIIASKFLGSSGSGTLYNAVRAIDYVTQLKERGFNVILSNNSWGGGSYYESLRDAILRAKDANILFVAAAGNNSLNIDTAPAYPASYNLENMVNVAAIDSNGNTASFSNYGPSTVHIAAPGVSIASTYPGNRYVYMNGTSMACPHVAGAIALIKSMSRDLTAAELKDRILRGARVLASLDGVVQTSAMVDVFQTIPLLNWNPIPPDLKDPNLTPIPTPTPTATPTFTPTSTPTPIPTPGFYTLSGMVTDAQGKRLAGVRVSVNTGDSKSYSVLSDLNGFFRFNDLWGPVDYALSASLPGYVFDARNGHFSRDSSITIQARAAKKFALSVKVITSDMKPLASAFINAGSLGGAWTNSAGMAVFNVDYNQTYSIIPSHYLYSFPDGVRSGTIFGDVTRVIVAIPHQ